ncbi:MAG: hypothetical protein R2813_07805 [Flavobacteriales bacterium]
MSDKLTAPELIAEPPTKHKKGCPEISVSKTFNHPVDAVYDRTLDWFETEKRVILKRSEKLKALNCQWLTDKSEIDVSFTDKGNGKTQLTLLHKNLDSQSDCDVMKNYWTEQIPNMVESL